jgi:hypothetical protein
VVKERALAWEQVKEGAAKNKEALKKQQEGNYESFVLDM